jgi:hypothetical protein
MLAVIPFSLQNAQPDDSSSQQLVLAFTLYDGRPGS